MVAYYGGGEQFATEGIGDIPLITQTYDVQVQPPNCYTVQPGQISGIDQPTTFCGERADQVRSLVGLHATEYDPATYGQKQGLGYQVAEGVYQVLDPYYGQGGALEPVTAWVDPERSVVDEFVTADLKKDLLLYGALAVGVLALLKR